jgi:thiosulfate/3-mercaptopyruvate sulfurtransferase
MRRMLLVLLFGTIAGAIVVGADLPAQLKDSDVIQPDQAVKDLRNPLFIHVGFSVLYRAAHITGSVYAGPGSTATGLDDLKKAVAGQPRMRQIILFCGCCPWDKCPNIRPAFALLNRMGYTNVKVLHIPTDLKTDWIDKGYPTDKRTGDGH